MINFSGSPTLINCGFTVNSGEKWGGAVCNLTASLTITNCTFTCNSATGKPAADSLPAVYGSGGGT